MDVDTKWGLGAAGGIALVFPTLVSGSGREKMSKLATSMMGGHFGPARTTLFTIGLGAATGILWAGYLSSAVRNYTTLDDSNSNISRQPLGAAFFGLGTVGLMYAMTKGLPTPARVGLSLLGGVLNASIGADITQNAFGQKPKPKVYLA